MNYKKLLFIVILFITTTSFAGITLDGVDDRMEAADSATLDSTTQIAFSISMKVVNNTGGTVISKRDDTADGNNRNYHVGYAPDGANEQFYWHWGSVADGTTGCISALANVWDPTIPHIFSGTLDWTGSDCTSADFYIDGVLVTTSLWFGQFADGPIATTAPVTLGLFEDDSEAMGSWTYYDVAIWKGHVLTTHDLNILNSGVKRASLQVAPASLSAYWSLDQGPDGTAQCQDGTANFFQDLSGNGNHFTAHDNANGTGLTCTGETVSTY